MTTRFSQRHGYRAAEPEIAIREDAPENLRFAVAQIAVDAGMHPSNIRQVLCSVLFVAPDQNNWSEYPNIWDEVQYLLRKCEWFKVYDIAEALYRNLQPKSQLPQMWKNREFFSVDPPARTAWSMQLRFGNGCEIECVALSG